MIHILSNLEQQGLESVNLLKHLLISPDTLLTMTISVSCGARLLLWQACKPNATSWLQQSCAQLWTRNHVSATHRLFRVYEEWIKYVSRNTMKCLAVHRLVHDAVSQGLFVSLCSQKQQGIEALEASSGHIQCGCNRCPETIEERNLMLITISSYQRKQPSILHTQKQAWNKQPPDCGQILRRVNQSQSSLAAVVQY